MVDIIVPVYNSRDVLINALSSICFQNIKDQLNVIIVDDCSSCDYDDYIDFYSKFISIKLIKLDKNVGPGCARNVGIENSTSKYIIFLDSDDIFFDSISVQKLLGSIEYFDADLAIGTLLEEKTNGYIPYKGSESWVLGKIYKRSFLIDNNIRFFDSRMNEDCGFNALVLLSNSKVITVEDNVVIWKNNINSITRKNRTDSFYKKFKMGYVDNMTLALECAIERGYSNFKIGKLAYDITLYLYYCYLKVNKNYFNYVLRKARRIFEINDEYISYLDEETKKKVSDEQLNASCNLGFNKDILSNSISYKEFVEMVKKMK